MKVGKQSFVGKDNAYQQGSIFIFQVLQAPENGFLVGEELDPLKGLKRPLLLSVGDMAVHGVVIGMTGSGKTGLNIILMEEALLNGVPVIAIDVKGDLSNLGLGVVTSNSSVYQTKSPENASEYRWDLTRRLQMLRESMEISIYTPGSTKGRPVSLVNCLRPPHETGEGLHEAASNVASSLLSLIGLEPEPFKTREHLLLSEVFEYAWKNNIELSFGEMMRMIFNPPFERVGGVDVESFIPLKQRKVLAFSLNTVIGSPNFRRWTVGVPMNIDYFLKSAPGKTMASVFYLSHLESGERMMFVSLLLQAIYSWMLKKGAAARPRLLLLFDEVYGFLPPFPRNPPSKPPLLSLIKQGRSFGITVFLSTQNPVDIDYKALNNVCLWIIGRLQTENDRRRILEGIAEADALKGPVENRNIEHLISTLRQREFVVYNVRDQSLRLMRSRQCFSNFVGPLTLEQVAMMSIAEETIHEGEAEVPPGLLELPPPLAESIEQLYLPAKHGVNDILKMVEDTGYKADREDVSFFYEPFLLLEGEVKIHRTHPEVSREFHFLKIVPLSTSYPDLDFLDGAEPGIDGKELKASWLEARMSHGYRFMSTNPLLRSVAGYRKILNAFNNYMAKSSAVKLYRCEQTGEYSAPGESKADFEKRQKDALRIKNEKRLRDRYDKRISRISSHIEKEVEKLEGIKSRLEDAKTFLLLKGLAEPLVRGRLKSLPRKIRDEYSKLRRIEKQVKLQERKISRLSQERRAVEAEYLEQLNALHDRAKPLISEVSIEPKGKEVNITNEVLIWVPMAVVKASSQRKEVNIKVNCFNMAKSLMA